MRRILRAFAQRVRRPDVSIIIPVYDKERYIAECLHSVLAERSLLIEVICIDDHSGDASLRMIEEIARADDRVRVVRNGANKGAAASRNIGISLARGRWIQFTDADDILPVSALMSLVGAGDRTGAEVVRGGLQTLRNGKLEVHPSNNLAEERIGALLELPELWLPWFHVCFLLSTELVKRSGCEYPALRAGEDPVFLAGVLTRANRIAIIPAATYIYRQDEQRPKPTLDTVRDYARHAEMLKGIYQGKFEVCWGACREFLLDDIRLLAAQATLPPQDREAIEKQLAALQ